MPAKNCCSHVITCHDLAGLVFEKTLKDVKVRGPLSFSELPETISNRDWYINDYYEVLEKNNLSEYLLVIPQIQF